MSDVTNRMFGQPPQWPDGMTTRQALTLYLYVPLGISFCFGLLRSALPNDMHQAYAILAWTLIFIPTWATYEASTQLLAKLLKTWNLPLWMMTILGALISGIYLKPYLIWISEGTLGIEIKPEQKAFPSYILRLPLDTGVFIALWTLMNVTAVRKFGIRRFGYTLVSSSKSDATTVTTPTWLAPYLAQGILAIEAEDHYVQVYTKRGKTLERRRFSDVINALDNAHGLRVHRSWWVSKDAVQSSTKDGQRLTLRLENDLVIPVSRSYRVAAQSKGLLK